jgi:PAS domain S-box-containing protein
MLQQLNGVWIIDANARTLYVCERMAEILGTSRADMPGQDWFGYLFPENRDFAKKLFSGKKQEETNLSGLRLRRADGSAIGVDAKWRPMFDVSGNVTGAIGTFKAIESTDISNEARPVFAKTGA